MEQLLSLGRSLSHPGVTAAGELLERQKSQDLPQVSTRALSLVIHRGLRIAHQPQPPEVPPQLERALYNSSSGGRGGAAPHRHTRHGVAPEEAALVVCSSEDSSLVVAHLQLKCQVSKLALTVFWFLIKASLLRAF